MPSRPASCPDASLAAGAGVSSASISAPPTSDRGLFRELIGDGRPALAVTALALLVSGAFALFLSFRREFLPHDIAFLGMTADELCGLADCRVVRFMFHDRMAFGGTLVAIAVLYLWLQAFPLRRGLSWAWWTFVASGALGFASFLTYLGYGYLDSWHGAGTLALLPVFATGLALARPHAQTTEPGWLVSPEGRTVSFRERAGRWGLLATGAGITLAGAVILYIGATEVFVTEDLGFMGVTRDALDKANPRLIPLIAHDRAGFGGGLTTIGILLVMCGWFARPSGSFFQAIAVAGAGGFVTAIATHFIEGYTNPAHLAPAVAGAALFTVSLMAEYAGWRSRRDALTRRE